MTARIYRPARNAMQSGVAKTKRWALEHDQAEGRRVEPLMGWTSSADTRQQVRLFFATREEAVAYATREGLAFRVDEPKEKAPRLAAYSDNFRPGVAEPWTH
ncbi:MAG: ETC complex I subunit [Ancylobacter novellus]|uniref:ETC complex I subunit n=1 Tax=Ancylobacter novellus TaxID=921 RepID=A0A2W5KIS8_ANCNO|nr:MAG: ETC complex I subunit [Ancylobacter novellus]